MTLGEILADDNTGGAHISELQAIGYRFPSWGERGTSFNILVIAALSNATGTRTDGFGEAELRNTLRPQGLTRTAWVRGVWDVIEETLADLNGLTIDVSSPTAAVRSIREIMKRTGSAVSGGLDANGEITLPNTCRWAVETALLDAAAKILDVSFSELIGTAGPAPETTVLFSWTYRPALDAYVLSQRPKREVAASAIRQAARTVVRSGKRLLRGDLRTKSGRSTLDSRIADIPEQDFSETELAAIVTLPTTRLAEVSGPIEAAEILSQTTGAQLVVTEVSPTLITRQLVLQLLGAVQGDCFLVANPLEGEESFVPNSAPGLGVGPNWDLVLSSKNQLYFSTGPLQADSEAAVNAYDLAGMGVLGNSGPQEQPMTQEVLSRGMGVARYSQGSFLAIDQDGTEFPFHLSRTQLSGVPSSSLCNHKEVTRMLLERAGVPTPQGRTFVRGDHATATAYAEQIGFPVVLKPAMGFRGIGVFAGLQSTASLKEAFVALEQSRLGHQDFIIEEHIPGEEYRILVVGDTAVGAIKRVPASVVADGVHSVAELIVRKNALRRLNPSLMFRPITLGWDARAELERQNLKVTDVPERGTVVTLSSTSNLSQGGDSVDILEHFHPSILEAAVTAVRAIPGLGFAGVDFQLEDPQKALSEQRGAILEMNAHASLSGVIFPMFGTPRPVPKYFIDRLVEVSGMQADPGNSETLNVQIEVKGRLTGELYWDWMADQARLNGISGWIRSTGKRSATIVATGPAPQIATFSIAAVRGPVGSSPTSAHTRHINPIGAQGFTVVEKDPEEVRFV